MKESERKALRLSLTMLALSFVSLWFCKVYLGINLDNLASIVIFIPLLGYLLFSGALKSFKYGSLEATLNDTVSGVTSARNEDTIAADMDEVLVMHKGGGSEGDLEKIRKKVNNSRYPILSVKTGTQGYYKIPVLLKYLDIFFTNTRFKFVVIITKDGKFVGYIAASRLSQILRNDGLKNEFLYALEDSNLENLRSLGMKQQTISTDTRIVDAIKLMIEINEDSLLVLDQGKNIAGIVERDYLVAKVLIKLTPP